MMKHDEIDDGFRVIGEFGPYQLLVFIMVGLTAFVPAITSYAYVFIAATPRFRCQIPTLAANDTYSIQNAEHLKLIEQHIPYEEEEEQCYLKSYNASSNVSSSMYLCDSWVFSDEYYGKTIVTDWMLVCNNASKKSTFATAFFAGTYGVVVCGIISDKIGRKKIAYIFIIMNAIVSALVAILANYRNMNIETKEALFGILRFLSGVFANFYTVCVVLAIEITGPSKRILATNTIYYFYIIGEYVALLICYFLKDYDHIYTCIACLMSIYTLYFWYVPESPRWCLTKGKHVQAYNCFKRIAKSNGRPMPEAYESMILDEFQTTKQQERPKTYSFIETIKIICRSRKLFIQSLAIVFNWLTNNFVYWGISLGTGELVGNPYLNFALFATVEFLAILSTQFIFEKFGRKKPYVISLLSVGVTLLLVLVVPKSMPYLVTVLALVGKFAISFTYNGVYILTSEIYPTVIRNTSLSVCQSVARLGSTIAPYINLLGTLYWFPIPFIIYGSCAFIASILAIIFIPETKDTKLPDTIEDLQ